MMSSSLFCNQAVCVTSGVKKRALEFAIKPIKNYTKFLLMTKWLMSNDV